ncbi:MAG: coproporphyrinogen dehydrogenase HemZ [Eubacteriaceae bacterium]|nr:coproporphyrinogen dehydrogenase HemZ [Eubacteriaceae bacterium]
MYNIKIYNYEKKYLLEELIKVFLPPDKYRLLKDEEEPDADDIVFNEYNSSDRNEIKREIYDKLSQLTGLHPDWGILTGIRPVKLYGELTGALGCKAAREKLSREFYISDDKLDLICDIYDRQIEFCGTAPAETACVYIGIPFCPTRCIYCSFASNQVKDEEIEKYLIALLKEIRYVGNRMKETGIKAESIYIGGGTPTTLTAEQLSTLIDTIYSEFDTSFLKEFTIEAGRPDTITEDKLAVMKAHSIHRISINPQSMKAETLKIIGRNHTPEEIRAAFKMAADMGIDSINADIIAGLPEETVDDFVRTLREVISMNPTNITVHSLAVKRASRLKDINPDFHYKQAETVAAMLSESRRILMEEGYQPYYLYRQKHMAGAYENIGYAKAGTECIYNIRIMDEHQHNIALGAGGITKVYFPEENRLERVPNVTNYEEYINRIDEMIQRKEENFFEEV